MCGRPEQNRRDDRAGNHCAHENIRRFAAGDVDEHDATDRAEHRDSAEHKWINNRCWISRQRQRADQNRADQTDRVGFKNVRRHARAIAHVVAHVIRDRGRIARIIFFQAFLDFADEIGADVRGFGINAATESREHADQTRAQRESDQAANRHVMSDHFAGDAYRRSRPKGAQDRPRANRLPRRR